MKAHGTTWVVTLAVALLAGASFAARAQERLVLIDFNEDPRSWHVESDGEGAVMDYRRESLSCAHAPQAADDGTLCAAARDAPRTALRLAYAFPGPRAREVAFRADLAPVDASRFDHLSFWIRGDARAGFGPSVKVQLLAPDPSGSALLLAGSYVVDAITDSWRKVTVPLRRMTGIRDWHRLAQFGVVVQARRGAGSSGAYHLARVSLEQTGYRPEEYDIPAPTPRKKAWQAAQGNRQAMQRALVDRLRGWPDRALVESSRLPREPREFLWRLARDTWRGLDALTDREHALPIDNVRMTDGSVSRETAVVGDYTNITNVGLHLAAVVAARELGFIDADEARARLTHTLDTLEGLETWQGLFYNYYDTTTLERTSHFVSFVDSAWLTAGLLVVRNAVPELRDRCTRLVERGSFRPFYDQVEQLMWLGHHTELDQRSEYHFGLLYTEARIGSLIAIGKGDAPKEHWFRMMRTLPERFDWQTQIPHARQIKTVHGIEIRGGFYRWRSFEFVPSWGGSMFEALMPTLVLDEASAAPMSLGRNDFAHAEIQRRYALETLGYPVWGLSPGATPGTNRYTEYGVRVLGVRGYPAGVVVPYASALALAVIANAAAENLRQLAERYPVYGEYGFYDAVDPVSGRVAFKYLALDQAMILIALANHLEPHSVQRYFEADPVVRSALAIVGEERFFD